MTKVLGIDLGTSYSAAAVLSDGKIRIIPPFEVKSTTNKPFPSVVSFLESGEILVGNTAVDQSTYNPKGTIFNVKRKIGSRETFEVFGKHYLPEFIEALILTKIKLDAEYFLREKITKAVITVPAYFNDNQRQATKTAGEIAGLEVIRVMTEPVAAAVSYGLGKMKEPTKVLVFDMGAGTLDVSVLEIDGSFFEVIGTGGDTHLGGIDIDSELTKYLILECKKQNGSTAIDDTIKFQLNRFAEKIKIELTEKDQISISETFFSQDSQISLKLTVTRQDLERIIEEPILKRCEQCIYNVLNDLKISSDDIKKVVLVGGPTRIPAIRKMISKILKEPEEGVDPEFSVASGAAIEGAVLASDENLPVLYQGLALLNVTPLDLGEKAVMKSGELGIKLMIPKNTTYPTEFTSTFYKKYVMSPKIEISVWQGDFENLLGFHGNENLGSFWLYVPQREDLEIEVTYKIDADGILTVSAVEKSTGNREHIVIEKIGGTVIPKPQLEYFEKETTRFEEEYVKKTYDVLSPYEIPIREQTPESNRYRWMCICLNDAKAIINAFHTGYDCRTFLSKVEFELFIQQDTQYAFAHIGLGMHPKYPIGIHNALKEDSKENRGMLTVVLIHELLHAIHPDWGHDQIRPAEHVLANKAGLYDALRNMDVLFLSGKMSFCNNQMRISDRSIKIKCTE